MKPMLAAKCTDINVLEYPLYASPKLDGIRALVVDATVLSRKLEPIPNQHIQRLFGKKKYNGLDGELMVGAATNAFLAATDGIMRVDGKPDVTFCVFDDTTRPNDPFKLRYARACERIGPNMAAVQHVHVGTQHLLTELEEAWLAMGYEGAMIRAPNGPYKFGRSTAREGWLLKLKRFEDSEATVLGVEELQRNHNAAGRSKVGTVKRSSAKAGRVAGGMLGALVVRDLHSGVEFNIGSGFTTEQRVDLWDGHNLSRPLIGKIVKYRYFPTGSKEKPRFPTFLGFRSPLDL